MPEISRKPRIALGSDHAGFPIKETIRQFLENSGYPGDDLGTWSEESFDYPDYSKAVGERAADKRDDYGIAVCGTGIGMPIAANKVPKIRVCGCARRTRPGSHASTATPTSWRNAKGISDPAAFK